MRSQHPMSDVTNMQPMNGNSVKYLAVKYGGCSHYEKLPSIESNYWTCADCGVFISRVFHAA